MDRLLQFLITGLSVGSLYALVALGIVLIYRSTRVLNFAHGEVATLGTFVTFGLARSGHAFALAAAGGLLTAALVAVAFYLGVLVPAQRRGAGPSPQLILTLALSHIIHRLLLYSWPAPPPPSPLPRPDTAPATATPP